jgi:hypothetical protein
LPEALRLFAGSQWDDGDVPAGKVANLVFLHDRALARLFPDLLECASRRADGAVEVGEMYMTAANERLALINELDAQLKSIPPLR